MFALACLLSCASGASDSGRGQLQVQQVLGAASVAGRQPWREPPPLGSSPPTPTTAPTYTKVSYSCTLGTYPKVALFKPSGVTAAAIVSAAAMYIVQYLRSTTFAPVAASIDGGAMTFNVGHSCFVNYVASNYIPTAFRVVTVDGTINPPVPRAAQWQSFIASLPTSTNATVNAAWSSITSMASVKAGDIISCSTVSTITSGSDPDVGYVMIAVPIDSGAGPAATYAATDNSNYAGWKDHTCSKYYGAA